MSFSERMKESLGTEGARVEVQPPTEAVSIGASAQAVVTIHGGTREARVDAVIVRLIEARRQWTAEDGAKISEEDARKMDRRQLMPTWERRVVHQDSIEVGETVDAHGQFEVPIQVTVPEGCATTDPACVITVNAQADIKEQIDPTGTATVRVGV